MASPYSCGTSSAVCGILLAGAVFLSAGCESKPPTIGSVVRDRQHLSRNGNLSETRYTLPEASGSYPVTVPEDGAALEIGFAVLGPAWMGGLRRVAFSITFDSGLGREVLFEKTLRWGKHARHIGWYDAAVDLDGVAGRTGTLTFDASTLSGQIPDPGLYFWASPRIIARTPQSPQRLNVILISIDTLRADHLGCYGYERATSPEIDRLAREGVLFRNAISPSTWTLPSHASMLTGLQPSRHGAVRFGVETPLHHKWNTLAELLWDQGYETAAFVGGSFVSSSVGFDQGFDRFVDTGVGSNLPTPFGRTVELAETWMAQRNSQPFFLFLHTYQTHMPYIPPPPYNTLFDPGYEGPYQRGFTLQDYKPYRTTDDLAPRALQHIEALYDGEIRDVDDDIGDLLEYLRTSGLAKNTCVVITSDHGEQFKEHGKLFHHHAVLYEELVHVPLVFWCPPHIETGRIVSDVVSVTDITPTLLDLTGIAIPEELDGASLLSALRGASLARSPLVVSEVDGSIEARTGTAVAIRDDRYKLIRDLEGTEALFDLHRDPAEKVDVRRQHAHVAQQFSEKLDNKMKHLAQQAEVPERKALEPATLDRMRALGYDLPSQ